MENKNNLENKCESSVKKDNGKLINCKNIGIKRYDNRLYAGIHCDKCWDEMIYSARQKSW